MSTIYFRQSEIKKFKRCPRSWWLSYKKDGLGYEPARSDEPLSGQRDVGTLVHAAIEAHRKGGVWSNPIEAFRILGQTEGWYSPEWERDVFSLARIMVQGYVQWLEETGADANEETLFVERQLSVPIGRILGEDVILTGKLDHIVRDRTTGEVIVSDVKTVDSLTKVGAELQVDDQGLNYLILLHAAENLPVRRFRHDMLRKVKRTATAKPPFYGRHEVAYNEEQLNNAWTHTCVVLEQMVHCLQTLGDSERYHHITVYPNPTRDCTWDCDFLPMCPMMDDGADWKGMLSDSGLWIRKELPTPQEELSEVS